MGLILTLPQPVEPWWRARKLAEKVLGEGRMPLPEFPPHVTLLYLGSARQGADLEKVRELVREVLASQPPIAMIPWGLGSFEPSESSGDKTPVFIEYSLSDHLEGLHDTLARVLAPFITASQFFMYSPHSTLGYLPEELTYLEHYGLVWADLVASDWVSNSVSLLNDGDVVETFALNGIAKSASEDVDESVSEVSWNCKLVSKSEGEGEEERQLVTGIVLEPDEVDLQNDTISPEEIELAAHKFLASYNQLTKLGVQHTMFGDIGIELVESWIAREDMELGGQPVKKGSWLITVHIADKALWGKVKDGSITGFSIGGSATVT